MEQIKPININNFNHYKISETGNVYNKNNKLLKLQLKYDSYEHRYYYITLHNKDIKKIFKVDYLVAITYLFDSYNETKQYLIHIDNNTLNNNVSNLKWVSYIEKQEFNKIHNNINHKYIIYDTSTFKPIGIIDGIDYSNYQINYDGEVINDKKERLTPKYDKSNYQIITLYYHTIPKTVRLDRLIAKVWIPDGDKYFNDSNYCVKNKYDIHGQKQYYWELKTKVKKQEINQYDMNNNFIKTFDSINSICKEFNIPITRGSDIKRVCDNKRKSAYNYIWKYKE